MTERRAARQAEETPAAAVLVERVGPVSRLTLWRPEQANALTSVVRRELLGALRAAANDDDVRAVLLTGAGRSFSAGQDLREHAEHLAGGGPAAIHRAIEEQYNPLVVELATMGKPVVVAVNGACAGAALGLVLACDVRIAADDARLVTAFSGIGLSADAGVSYFLPRAVGLAKARALLCSNVAIGAEEALRLGLFDEVVPPAELAGAALALATRLARGPTLAFAALKRLLLANQAEPLAAALAAEADVQAAMVATADHAEGVAAFLARRAPEFRGR